MFYGHLYAHDGLNKPSKGNEAKSKMKHPSDISTPRFERGW